MKNTHFLKAKRGIRSILPLIIKFCVLYLSSLPVIWGGCNYAFYSRFDALSALPVLAAGWALIVLTTVVIAPGIYLKTLLCLAVFLTAGHFLTAAILQERIDTQASISCDADDAYYLNITQHLRPYIIYSPYNLVENWENTQESEKGLIAASLRGYPFFMAYVFAFLPNDLTLHYLVAVSLNLTCLCLLYLIIFAALKTDGLPNPFFLLTAFSGICLNLFLDAAQCRKDVFLILLVFTMCVYLIPKLFRQNKKNFLLIVCLAFLAVILMTIRPAYLTLPAIMTGALLFRNWRRLPSAYLLTLGLATVGVIFYFYLTGFKIREINLLDWEFGQNPTVLASGGIASKVYAIPVLGPFLYYFFLPFPHFEMKFSSIADIINFINFTCILAVFLKIIFQIKFFWQNNFTRVLILWSIGFLFITDVGATLLNDPDPRYKGILLPVLCIFACIVPDKQELKSQPERIAKCRKTLSTQPCSLKKSCNNR